MCVCVCCSHCSAVSVWYLEEGAVGLQCAGEVVGVGAAEAVAAARGSGLLTVGAAESQPSSQSQLHVDQSARLGLIHLAGPQSTVQVDLIHKDRRVMNPFWFCWSRLSSGSLGPQ